jgi:hypothetical protein
MSSAHGASLADEICPVRGIRRILVLHPRRLQEGDLM